MRTLATVALLLFCVSLPNPALAGLIVNGGFETGDFTGWTISGDLHYYGVRHSLGGILLAHSGWYGTYFGSVDGLTYLSQTIPTEPGASYTLSGWLMNVDLETPPENRFEIRWDGNLILAMDNAEPFPYTLGVFPGLVASGLSTEVKFGFWNPPAWWSLDDVDVTPSVPEPASVLLGGLGVALIALRLRQRRKAA
jgi:hypothetical protein